MLTLVTLDAMPTLAERTVKPTELARLALPTPTAVFSMVVKLLDNLPANPTELADLAKRTPIAQPALLTVVPMEVVILARQELLITNVDLVSMEVKSLANLTAILSPTLACLSVLLIANVSMTVLPTVTSTVDAA